MSGNYVNKTYRDGDKDIYFPLWRQILQREMVNFEAMSLEKEQERILLIKENEIALKHPGTGATIKLGDDGSIELFVNEDTGMRFDSRDNAIIFYGDSVHFATKEMRFHTKPHGFIWNNHNLNPYLYHGDKVEGERVIPKVNMEAAQSDGNVSIAAPLFQEQQRKFYYDDKVSSIIEELGIESARIKRGG